MQKLSLDSDLREVLEMFPRMKLIENKKRKSLVGEVAVFDTMGNYVNSYDVKVLIPINYPYGFPALFETSNKFEHGPDRHISDDGSCCVCSLQEADIRKQKGITIKCFFLDYVLRYFANQLYFESEAEWANGDFEHGFEGILQFYRELFQTSDLELVLSHLTQFDAKKINRNDPCFCGANSKLKYCHYQIYKTVKELSKARLGDDIKVLQWILKDMKRQKNLL